MRLRLLNGSTARTYTFAFDDRPMTMVASDGGLLDEPLEVDHLRLAPAERAEVIVEFSGVRPTRLAVDEDPARRCRGAGDLRRERRVRCARVPRRLASLAPSPEPAWPSPRTLWMTNCMQEEASITREFRLNNREINGEEMDMNRIDEVVHVGDTGGVGGAQHAAAPAQLPHS